MNTKRIVGTILAAVVAGAVGFAVNGLTTTDASSANADSRPRAAGTPAAPADLVLAPGAAGPVQVGQSKSDAVASGLFDGDVPPVVDGCAAQPLAWKAPFADALDVQTLRNGEIASIGVRAEGPATAAGVGVGSTYAEVLASAPGRTVETGYGQSGVLVHDATTGGWIGFLFDVALDDLTADDQVTFVELTDGDKPSLVRDGC